MAEEEKEDIIPSFKNQRIQEAYHIGMKQLEAMLADPLLEQKRDEEQKTGPTASVFKKATLRLLEISLRTVDWQIANTEANLDEVASAVYSSFILKRFDNVSNSINNKISILRTKKTGSLERVEKAREVFAEAYCHLGVDVQRLREGNDMLNNLLGR